MNLVHACTESVACINEETSLKMENVLCCNDKRWGLGLFSYGIGCGANGQCILRLTTDTGCRWGVGR